MLHGAVTTKCSQREGKIQKGHDPAHTWSRQGNKMSYERLLSLQSLSEVASPWRGLTLNRCLVLALQLVLVSTSPAVEGSDHHKAPSSLHPGTPRRGPLEHMLSALREGWPPRGGQGGQEALVRFGVCPGSEGSPVAALARLVGAGDRLRVMHPETELVEEKGGGGGGRLVLTFHLPLSPLLKLHPVLALASSVPMTTSDMEVSFTSPALQPPTQTLCLSSKTQYLVLTGQPSGGHKWRVSVTLMTPETESGKKLSELQSILIGGETSSEIIMTPLLLLSLDRATGKREPPEPCGFLCELQSFLSEVLPQVPLQNSAPFPLASLNSLPPLLLGPSSSEAFLLGLINSSGPMLFSFPQRRPVLGGQGGELSLTPGLLETLRLRLAEAVGRLGWEELGFSGMDRLLRLQELSALPRPGEELHKGGGGSRERQYRALLLLKALHMVQGQWEVKRGLRVARASPEQSSVCQLQSLTVSLESSFKDPLHADIKNCEGSCHFPILQGVDGNDHVMLLNSQVQGGRELGRSPCCVPLEYGPLTVVELDDNGATISIKDDMVAKKCGCR
ncbi:muellerian-inhibiting factor-like [Hypomesus transpacificus]|uniref:muellerian-inhibiting factor-like n=1 Tax=Hypomesus transpacificus TaxID=137520 RepID=UPI001F076BCB|nr:muellerian-inhibiting factor-like [Hypomesus transpacificus]